MTKAAALFIGAAVALCVGCGRDAAPTPAATTAGQPFEKTSESIRQVDTVPTVDWSLPAGENSLGRTDSGELGFRLGTELQIEGVRRKVEEGRRRSSIVMMRVDTVDGKKLETPVSIAIENTDETPVDLPVERRCILHGHESGRMIGSDSRAAQIPRQFWRYFIATSVEVPDPQPEYKIASPDSKRDDL